MVSFTPALKKYCTLLTEVLTPVFLRYIKIVSLICAGIVQNLGADPLSYSTSRDLLAIYYCFLLYLPNETMTESRK